MDETNQINLAKARLDLAKELINALNAERIRSVSDYDDFYIASKNESINQVEFANRFYKKALEYINKR